MNPSTPIAAAVVSLMSAPVAWSQTAAGSPGSPLTQAEPRASSSPLSSIAAPIPGGATSAETAGGMQHVTIEGERSNDFLGGGTSLTKLPADLHDVPQSVVVINRALLETQGATSLADALRNVPGITLGGAEGGQIGNNINLNGFAARTDINLDGFRDRGQYYRDTFALDAVEVLMGPSSMLFGRGSTGGVVNQVSKQAQLKAITAGTASITTNGMVRLTGDVDRATGETSALRISAMAQHGRPTTRDVMTNEDYGVAPTLRIGIGTPTEITLSALLQRNRDMPDYGVSPLNGRPVDVPRNNFYGFTDDRTIQEITTLGAELRHQLAQDASFRNRLQLDAVRTDARETASQGLGTIDAVKGFTPLDPPGTSDLPLEALAVRLQSHDRVIEDRTFSDQADFSLSAATGSVGHNLLAGAEIGHDTYMNQSLSRTGECNGIPTPAGYVSCEPLLAPAHVDSPADAVRTSGNHADSVADTYAAYLADTAEIGAQFKLVGGLRYDRFSARIHNTVTLPQTVTQSVDFTSVRAGAIWAPTPAQSYYASYSTSFNPSLEQLTNTTGKTAPLAPEENHAWEGGAKWDADGGRSSLNAAVFGITKLNARSQDADGHYTPEGTVRVRGVRLGGAGEIMDDWKVFAGYAFLDAKIVDAIAVGTEGKVPGNTPRHSATLWTTYGFLRHWEIGGGSVYQSERFANNTNTVRVGGYARWDTTVAYRQRNYDVRLNVFNLFDRRYYENLIQSDGGRAVPGTGRSAMLSFSYHI